MRTISFHCNLCQHPTAQFLQRIVTSVCVCACVRACVRVCVCVCVCETDVAVGLPDLPYFTGDPIFQTPSPASGGKPPGRTNLPYSVRQIVASLR